MLFVNRVVLVNAPALVKVGVFFLAWVGCWLPVAIPLAIALQWSPRRPISIAQKLPLLASLYLLAPLIIWQIATLQGQPLASYGLLWNGLLVRSLLAGLLAGVAGVAGMYLIQHCLGWITWLNSSSSPGNWVPVLLSTGMIGLGVSFVEELVFRGFLLSQLQEDYSPWLAATIASAIFAILHLIWEGRENIPQLPGLWLMGMVLVLARSLNQENLGLAWGLHAGWIWAIASLETTQAFVYPGDAPEWLTGFGKKPLAGGVGVLFLLSTALLLWAAWLLAQRPLLFGWLLR